MSLNKFDNISVYGGGGWGCALACQVARVQKEVLLFLRNKNIASELLNNHTNKRYLEDVELPHNIIPTINLANIFNSDAIIIAVPSHSFSNVINVLKAANLNSDVVLLIATKGMADNPVQLLSDRLKSLLPNPFAFISGPNFAKEVAKDLLTPATVASSNINLAEKISNSLSTENFQITTTTDIVTVQIAGAVKNIIAIKSGIFEGMGYQENAKAGLLTQGLKEIMILSQTLGGKFETLLEPSVLGDLALTCYSKTSRNTKFGYEFALTNDPKHFLNNYPHLIEGRESVNLILKLAEQYHLNLPIIFSVAQALKS